MLCGIVFLIMFTIKTSELIGKTDPFLFMLEVQSTSDEIDLYKLGYIFAIEDID